MSLTLYTLHGLAHLIHVAWPIAYHVLRNKSCVQLTGQSKIMYDFKKDDDDNNKNNDNDVDGDNWLNVLLFRGKCLTDKDDSVKPIQYQSSFLTHNFFDFQLFQKIL